MSKIMVEMVEGVFQYVTLIDNRKPISLSNIGYSIYPNRAMSGEFIDQVSALFDDRHDFKFKLVDDKGNDIKDPDSKPEIVWINCSDRMPPDDADIIAGSLINRHWAEPMSGYSLKKWIAIYNHAKDLKWTEFTQSKWEFLNGQ